MTSCHSCRLDYKRANKAQEWEDKFSEREIAKNKRFCPSCRRDLTWWWFIYLPITAEQIARYLARGDKKRQSRNDENKKRRAVDVLGHGETDEKHQSMAQQKTSLQLED